MLKLLCVHVAVGVALLTIGTPLARGQNVVTKESTVTAKVDRIERGQRLVTLHGDQNQILTVYVDPSVTTFDDLQTGDTVTVHYVESTIVELKPNATLADVRDTTAAARKAGKSNVVEQQTVVVTIENIDPQGQVVTYRNASNMKMMKVVNDPALLKGLKPGDTVKVTLTRERAIQIDRRR
jgi:hypothetical protein